MLLIFSDFLRKNFNFILRRNEQKAQKMKIFLNENLINKIFPSKLNNMNKRNCECGCNIAVKIIT